MIRQIFVIFIFIFSTMPLYAAYNQLLSEDRSPISLNFAFDMNGKLHSSFQNLSYDTPVEMGLSLGAEYKLYNSQESNLQSGVGIKYLIQREDFSFIPFYVFGRAALNGASVYGHIGYNLFMVNDLPGFDINGGIYWGVGTSCHVGNNICLFIEYSQNSGSIGFLGQKIEMAYNKISFGFQIF